jgi:sialidase-1
VSLDPTLMEPVCQASVLRHVADDGEVVFLFSNPAALKRERLTVRASVDRCKTWNAGQLLYPGSCGYSDLCSISGDTVGCLYERDRDGQPYGAIDFARMPLTWLLDAGAIATEEEAK